MSIGLALATILVCSSVSANPPADCVNKFVGSWTTTVRSTGQSYPSVIRADGTLSSTCFMCMPTQRWTCQGNTFIPIDPYRVEQQLSADGTRMDGSCCFGVRQGPPPQQVTSSQRAPAASCEPTVAQNARQHMQAAQAAARVARSERTFANWSIADENYALAAALFAQCGDTANRDLAAQEREKLKADLRSPAKEPVKPPAAAERRTPANCTDAPVSYLKWREGRKGDGLGGHGYVLENSCRNSAIEVRYVTLSPGCKQETQTQRVSAGGDLPDYSYCNTAPRIVSAQFAK